jgi:hypothetical protein
VRGETEGQQCFVGIKVAALAAAHGDGDGEGEGDAAVTRDMAYQSSRGPHTCQNRPTTSWNAGSGSLCQWAV